MPLGIRPIIDFPFKKTFGSPENKICLISLLNAILNPRSPIVDVTLLNPFNMKDFEDDKLSVLDIKAIDQSGAIYDVEMQIAPTEGLAQRIVFYPCELYVGQILEGNAYTAIHPVYSIWLLNGILWPEATKVHHAFRLMDAESGRVLEQTIEIHTLELGRYNRGESGLNLGDTLDCWLFWLLHAQDYEPDALLELLPNKAIQTATQAITKISQMTEDKAMYDSRAKAIRDRKWDLEAAFREGEVKGEIKGEIKGKIEGEIKGKIEGEIKLIRTLQELLHVPFGQDSELMALTLNQLEALSSDLQMKLRNRTPS